MNRRRGADIESVRCPQLVRGYHELVGGVDRHDQLRLQLTNRFREYYVSLFFGLADLVVVNCFMTYNQYKKDQGSRSIKRADFMIELQQQLLSRTVRDFAEVELLTRTGTPVMTRKRQRMASAHTTTLTDEWRGEGKSRKRRQRACKVCSLVRRKVGRNANGTS